MMVIATKKLQKEKVQNTVLMHKMKDIPKGIQTSEMGFTNYLEMVLVIERQTPEANFN